jgi:hypothetical protein
VNDTDYIAYLEDDGRPEFLEHLQECGYCRNEIATYQKEAGQLHQQFRFIIPPSRSLCPEAYKLGEFLLGLLEGVEQRTVAAHIKACPFCREEAVSLQEWLPEADSTSPDLSTSQKWFDPVRGLRIVLASLFNPAQSHQGFAFAGVRGAAERAPKVFKAEEVQITLMVQPAGPRRNDLLVEGLVQRLDTIEPDGVEGAEVRLMKDTELLATSEIDEIGNFVFENIAPCDKFNLEIVLSDKIVQLYDVSAN